MSIKNLPLSSEQNKFLYSFWLYRFPDNFPLPFWKIINGGLFQSQIFSTLLLCLITLLFFYGIKRRHTAFVLVGLGIAIFYVFALKGLPLSVFFFYVAYKETKLVRNNPSDNFFDITTIIFSGILLCTWGQLILDIYHKVTETPPFLIDNTRFLVYLAPFSVLLFWISTQRLKPNLGLYFLNAICVSLLGLTGAYAFDSSYLRFAKDHNIFWRAQFDSDPHFELTGNDKVRLLEFAKYTDRNSVFLYDSTSSDSLYFRLRAGRSIAINFNDMGIKYYSQKSQLASEWPIYVSLLEAYRNGDVKLLCSAISDFRIDYVVFPSHVRISSCMIRVMNLDNGAIYKVINAYEQ
jgi:hypothetical protein